MPIEQTQCYTVKCDGCNEYVMGSDVEILHFPSIPEAIEGAKVVGFHSMGSTITCEDCDYRYRRIETKK